MNKMKIFLWAVALCCPVCSVWAQKMQIQRQWNLSKRGVPSRNFSGIAHISGQRYACVSDKENGMGYYPFEIVLDSIRGKLLNVTCDTLHTTRLPRVNPMSISAHDAEDVVYVPRWGTLFIADEAHQTICEYKMDGTPTGRSLNVPQWMGEAAIYSNYGFEALCYSPTQNLFWTATESTLRVHGSPASSTHPVQNVICLQSFGADLAPKATYAYLMDVPLAKKTGRSYAFGVSAMTALSDGRLLMLEREFHVSKHYMNSWVVVKLYCVNPREAMPLSTSDRDSVQVVKKALRKELWVEWKTRFNVLNTRLANYEGMTLGPRLEDGRQTLLLISDSQGGMGRGSYRLKDYLKVLVLPREEKILDTK